MTAQQIRETRMNDDQWKASLEQVTDPKEALQVIVDNEQFVGGDPYYSDLVRAMLNMAKRLAQ